MSDLAARIERRWAVLARRGPYVLLVLSFALAIPLADELGTTARLPLLAALAVVAGVAHWWCVDRRWGQPLDDTLGKTYVLVRTAFAFVVTWMNPFFCVYAFVGYLDTPLYLRPRAGFGVLAVTAVTMSGAQSGGLPPSGVWQTAAFFGLFALNAGMAGLFTAIANQETELAEERTATIDELERTNRRLEEALAENAALQQALVQRARDAGVRDERERLALEIHDTVAQGLAGIVTQLQAADDTRDVDAARQHRVRAAALARSSLAEARRAVAAGGPMALDGAELSDALERIVAEWSRESGVKAEIVVTGEALDLSAQTEAVLVRIAQEALANTAQHAKATRVGVTVSYLDDEVLLDIRDDGRGFDPTVPATYGGRGFGLSGMRRRAERIGAELVVESAPGAGTAVSLRVTMDPGTTDDGMRDDDA